MNTITVTRADIEQGTRTELIAYLKSVEAYAGHSRDGLDAMRDHALATHDRRRYAEREVPEQPHAPVPDPDTDPAWTSGQIVDGVVVPNIPAASDDRMERLTLAKAEHQALQAWIAGGKDGERPATANLDAMNADYAAGTRSTRKAGSGKGRQVAPRRAEANAIAAKGKRGAGRRVTDAELNLHIATVMAEHPEATRNDELEYAYWVAKLAVTRARWYAAWAYVAEAGTAAVVAAKGEAPEPTS